MMTEEKQKQGKAVFSLIWKILCTLAIASVIPIGGILLLLVLSFSLSSPLPSILFSVFAIIAFLLFFFVIWWKKGKLRKVLSALLALSLCGCLLTVVLSFAHENYLDSIRVDTTPAINTDLYLPFDDNSKIARLAHPASLQLQEDLPIVDGAAACFPLYSAFVNATYPKTTELYDDFFTYNNTRGGYSQLAEKETDLFFGAYPSKEQIAAAKEKGTTFVYTPIGYEAFVFFVHKDNPVENLTAEQIKKIYSGEITNWKEVGGADQEITAYQRNEGSGSQSMLIRFMGDTPLMDPPREWINGGMGGIIEDVADYRSQKESIGFSFRYYVEGIIQNPDIKILSVDGIKPTKENIQNGSYPIITSLYAVGYEGNEKESVSKFLAWILSEEGQELVEKTGYVPLAKE